MKIKKGLFSYQIEFSRDEFKDKKFIDKVKKELFPKKYETSELVKLLVKLGIIRKNR